MTDGNYSKLAKRLKELKDNGSMVVKRQDLEDYIDLAETPREELEKMCKSFMAAVTLYQGGFRSVVRKSGLFVDYELIDNPVFLQKLVDNSTLDATQKQLVCERMKKNRDLKIEDMYSQMAFKVEVNGDLTFFEEITDAQIIEMLEKMRDGTSDL